MDRAALRRFNSVKVSNPADVKALPDSHPAMVEKRTLFPTTVVDAKDSPNLLVSAVNNRKIGKEVLKGPWAGKPIFTLTLEERATCPSSCFMLARCYGNAMHMARRNRHGEELEALLHAELVDLAVDHPGGFVVRKHD